MSRRRNRIWVPKKERVATPRGGWWIPRPASGRHRAASTVDVGRADAIPIQLMKVTIAVDPDHPGGSWWRAARDAKHPPPELRPLLTGKATTIEVAPKRARELRAWCAAFEGWDPEAAPLSFVGLVGRPPSPRRSEGARSLHVRLAPYELTLLEPLASARDQSLADLLLTSAVVEARREEARATDDGDGDETRAEVVALDAIEVGDLLYTDLRCLPRGHAERVTAVQRQHNLWRVELASGPPAWFGTGARVWRKRKRGRP